MAEIPTVIAAESLHLWENGDVTFSPVTSPDHFSRDNAPLVQFFAGEQMMASGDITMVSYGYEACVGLVVSCPSKGLVGVAHVLGTADASRPAFATQAQPLLKKMGVSTRARASAL